MLTYRNTNIVFAVLLVAVLLLCWQLDIGYAYTLLLLLPYIAIISWGSYFIHSGFHVNAICHGDRSQKKVALTFDDGPSPEHTEAILDILKQYHVQATFFCIGERINQYPDIIKRADAEGHIIANHSYHHTNFFDLYHADQMSAELARTNKAIEYHLHKTPLYFRPPYGVTNPNVKKAIAHVGCTTVGWSLRSMDTVSSNPERLLNKVTSKLKGGDIVLFHDTQSGTVSVLGKFLEYCRNNGFEVVPLNELINKPAYA